MCEWSFLNLSVYWLFSWLREMLIASFLVLYGVPLLSTSTPSHPPSLYGLGELFQCHAQWLWCHLYERGHSNILENQLGGRSPKGSVAMSKWLKGKGHYQVSYRPGVSFISKRVSKDIYDYQFGGSSPTRSDSQSLSKCSISGASPIGSLARFWAEVLPELSPTHPTCISENRASIS